MPNGPLSVPRGLKAKSQQRPTFGTPGGEWTARPGAYGIVHRDGSVLAVEHEGHLFLPGGAIEEGESAEDALQREFEEETAFTVRKAMPFLSADQFPVTQTGERFKKECSFFLVEVDSTASSGAQPEHQLRWLRLPQGI